jgi:DNA-binding NarL/FixJ family response regulator
LAPFRTLTEREREALLAMGHGQSVSEIAAAWVVSEATVRTHVRGVLGKLDVRSQLAAVGMALRCGWLRAPGDSARVTRE